MDVSRIDAFRPKIYDWRNMTAKEIIKHEDDGDKVPAMYLQWAKEFLASIQADDVTTYEIATSGKHKSPKTAQKEDDTKKAESATEQDSEIGDNEQPKLSKAQQIRKDMQDDGVSLRKQAKYFRKQSRNLASDSFFPAYFILPALRGASGNELGKLAFAMIALDARMENIFTNLKNIAAANKVSNSSDNNDAIVQRAYEQGQELNKIAQDGHSSVNKTESKMDSIGASMAGYTPTFDDAIDFGEQTVDIGKELGGSGFFLFFKGSVINAGNRAIKMGDRGLKSEESSQAANNTNLDDADEFHNFIESKSGVESTQPKQNYKRDKRGMSEAEKKEVKKEEAEKQGQSAVDKAVTNPDAAQKEDIKKEDKDLPAEREELVKLIDEDRSTKGEFVKNASKKTTPQDAPSKKEFADDNQKTEAANEFDKAKTNDGADERTVTMAVREQSKSADDEAVSGLGLAKLLSQMSQASYNELDENIQDLMNEINSTEEEIKNEIRAVNSGTGSDISKINQLNEEIRAYGSNAQMMAGSYEGIINGYASELENIGASFDDAISKGNMAISAGSELIGNSEDRWLAFRLVNEIIGKSAINIGERTASDGTRGIAEKSEASSTINSNLLSIASLKSEIQAKTGVEGVNGGKPKGTGDNNNVENKDSLVAPEEKTEDIAKPNLEKPKEKVKDSEKAVKIAQNDGTDTNDKQNTDINAIMARKVRRGEVNMG